MYKINNVLLLFNLQHKINVISRYFIVRVCKKVLKYLKVLYTL